MPTRRLQRIRHASLDGVVRHSDAGNGVACSDWSAPPRTPAGPMANRLNAATKFVATHRPRGLAWGPAVAIGPGLVLPGSSSRSTRVPAHGLADQLVPAVSPLLPGSGQRLFAQGAPARLLRLADSPAAPQARGGAPAPYTTTGSGSSRMPKRP